MLARRVAVAKPLAAGQRMEWLDALRALAALLVVYAHLSRFLFRDVRAVSAEWLHAGPAGVMLFFLVSGYIIPASLERRGSLRTFWISRAGRLFPLYLVVVALVVALGTAGLVPLDPYLAAHPVTVAAAHLTMLPFLLGVPLVTPVIWTLTFEMAFYLLVSALFAVGAQRASGRVALVFAAVAVLTVPLAPQLLTAFPGLTAVVAAALVAGVAAVASGRRRLVIAGGLLLGATALILLLANEDPTHVFDGLLIIAVMFAGTTIYRADHGQTTWWRAGIVLAAVAAALLWNWFAELRSLNALIPRYETRSVITLLVFGGLFTVGMLTRHRRTPKILAFLGVISYSVYLVHYVLIQLLGPVLGRLGDRLPALGEIPVAAAYLALVVGISWLTHRYVEKPGQRLARRATARWGTTGAAPPPEVESPPAASHDPAMTTR